MIVTCKECNTSFNLDEGLVKQTGSKVQCSKCKNIFIVYPPVPPKEPEKPAEVISDFEIEKEARDFEISKPDDEKEREDLELEIEMPSETKKVAEGLGVEAEAEAEELDLSELEELLEMEDEQPAEEELALEDLELEIEMPSETKKVAEGLGVEAEAEEDMELEFEIGDIEKEDLNKDETADALVTEEKEKEVSAAFEMEIPKGEPVAEKAVEGIKAAETTEAVDTPEFEAETEEHIITADRKVIPLRKKRISTPVLILLILALLAVAAYGAFVMLNRTGVNIPFVTDLVKAKPQDLGNLKISVIDIKGRFIENFKIGKLFVITGRVKNEYPVARSFITVKGNLYTKGKILKKRKTVFCGNVISDQDLLNFDLDSIENRLSNRFGDNRSNVRVGKGETLPFMIVFSGLSENLEEFTVEVERSYPEDNIFDLTK